MTTELEFTESGASPPKRRGLSKVQRKSGAVREIILAHEGEAGRIAARVVRVETGGVDRTTGEPLQTYFGVTVKLPRQPEVTRTFTGQGDPVKAEWNARIAYLMAQHGCGDFSTPLGDLGERRWPEPKNLTALAKLRERHGWPETFRLPGALEPAEEPSRTRMNTGDSHAELRPGGEVAIPTALASGNGPEPLPGSRAWIEATRLPACRCQRGCCATCHPRREVGHV